VVIDRRAFLGSLAGLAAPPGSLASAQSTSKVHRIGILGSTPEPTQTALLETFLGRLRELGYAEGRNLVVERRFSEGRNERYRALAKELVDLKMDVIVAPGTAAALAAKEATSTVPIVTVVAGDPVGSRLIASFARPGGNVTGMSSSGGVTTKHLELMKEIMPRLSRVAVLSNPTTTLHTALFKELEGAGRTLRVHLRPVAVSSPKDLESAFAAILRERPEALIPLDDPPHLSGAPTHRRLRAAASAPGRILPAVLP
jgi:putative ABC transport system substrate-binding protein